jgi:hypothetical protein
MLTTTATIHHSLNGADAALAFLTLDDEAANQPYASYWPCGLLNTFVLKMAAAGHCVNTDMMLGHRPYAHGRLAVARHSSDESLRALAERLQLYFDASAPECCHVAAALDEVDHARMATA